MKARRLGLHVPEDLERLAVKRGCRYYAGGGDATTRLQEVSPSSSAPVLDPPAFSTEELAVALLSIGLHHSQHRLRMGAAMLAAEGNSAHKLVQLARRERCEVVLRYIAECGRRVEPGHDFWQTLLALLPDMPLPAVDVLPHMTRFVAMTGYTKRGKETVMQWIRPAIGPTA